MLSEYIYTNGKIKTSQYTIETNALFGSILTLHTIGKDVLGKMVFKVSFPDHPELKTPEQTFYLFEKNIGVLFQNKPFAPAGDNDILVFENNYQVTLCDDYKQFLKSYNGVTSNWWHYTDKFYIEKGAYQAESYGHIYTRYPFHDDLSQLKKD
ncbi:hypothetical protein [Aquimarina sp. SS2-1]|uniref:hypothetical protein n=1 Tax=Aquimarina besae TaxID=3342247 RepID=UPI00366EB31C